MQPNASLPALLLSAQYTAHQLNSRYGVDTSYAFEKLLQEQQQPLK